MAGFSNYRRAKKDEGVCPKCVHVELFGTQYYCGIPCPFPRVSKVKVCDEFEAASDKTIEVREIMHKACKTRTTTQNERG